MSHAALLLPVFVQVALTFALIIWMGVERGKAVRSKETRIGDIALGERAWPPRALQIANAFHNQLELPLIFYVLVAMVLATNAVSLPLVVLAWAFVLLRLAHAYVHTGSNYVPNRAMIYRVGAIVLMIMWGVFAVQILTGA